MAYATCYNNNALTFFNSTIFVCRLHGSYETLKGGNTIEAMEDCTGGVSEIYDLQQMPEDVDLFETMFRAHKKGSLMG